MSEYGYLHSYDQIKAEVYARGPVSCTIYATAFLEFEYTGGIYAEYKRVLYGNHVVSIVGWGVSDEGVEYWIVRNSWGRAWGEDGFYRAVTSTYKNGQGSDYNGGLEYWCNFGVIDGWKSAAEMGFEFDPEALKTGWSASDRLVVE